MDNIMPKHNPWRGLASYRDPFKYEVSGEEYRYKFCGRDSETKDIVKLIDNNLLITLYGRTGVGKTSLLNAGVFPILRQRGYFPVYMRLAQESTGKSYAEAIISKINNSALTIHKKRNTTIDYSSTVSLWEYFCTTSFSYQDQHNIYPIIVLDQFEEIFYGDKEKAKLLLLQIRKLLSDDLAIPEGYSTDTNFRFVLSIREDNLFLLEDSIDELSLDELKENRFRLRPMSEKNARFVILEPGSGCIDQNESEAIINKIVKISKDNDGSISSLILSFICSLLYEQAKAANEDSPVITLKQIPETKDSADKILTDFYIKFTNKKQRHIIEENLLTEDGHRKPSNIDNSKIATLLTGRTRILQKIETDTGEKVEIVHDRLAKVIYNQRRRRDSNRFRNLLRIVVLLCLAVTFHTAIISSWTSSISNNIMATYINSNQCDELENPKELYINKFNDNDIYEDRDSPIERIYIGANVGAIESILIMKDSVEFIVSPNNKYFKWKQIKSSSGEIGYLCRTNSPNEALYMQNDIYSNGEYRLPVGVDVLSYHGTTIRHKATLPHYGERNIVIHNEDIKWYQDDRYISSLEFKGVKEIPSYAFMNCDSLKFVNLKDVEKINNSAFEDCDNLTEITFDNEVTIGSRAFSKCIKLAKVHLPKTVSGTESYAGQLFDFCLNLKEVYLPDVVYNMKDIWNMFSFCPNLHTIHCSGKSHFREEAKTGIWYYDSIPAIFSNCKISDYKSDDNAFRVNSGFVSHDGIYINILTQFMKEDEHGNYYVPGISSCFIFRVNKDSKLTLPQYEQGKYHVINLCMNEIKDIYTPVATPEAFDISFSYSTTDTKHITLHVPYDCQIRYLASKVGSKYKKIVQEGKNKRIVDTLTFWWDGIKWNFRKYDSLFYPAIVVGLILLFACFYYIRIRQMKNNGFVIKKKAVSAGIIGDIVALVGFIPVYWMIYVILQNHINLKYGMDDNDYLHLSMVAGTLGGIISAYLCAYLFVFAGKGKIFKSVERMVKGGLN